MSDTGKNVISSGQIIPFVGRLRPVEFFTKELNRDELQRRLDNAGIRGVVEGKGRQKTQKENSYIPPLRQVAEEAFKPDSYYDEHLQNIATRLSDMNAFDTRFLLVTFDRHGDRKSALSFFDAKGIEEIEQKRRRLKSSPWEHVVMLLDANIPLKEQLKTISGQPYISPHHAKNDPVISPTYLQAVKNHTPEPYYR